MLIELDRLIQLIESPILACMLSNKKIKRQLRLADVRMDLLSEAHQRPLASVFSALLMLLPQTEAFNTLHRRLQAIPHLQFIKWVERRIVRTRANGRAFCSRPAPKSPPRKSSINFASLLQHFDEIVEQRKASVRKHHIEHSKQLLN